MYGDNENNLYGNQNYPEQDGMIRQNTEPVVESAASEQTSDLSHMKLAEQASDANQNVSWDRPKKQKKVKEPREHSGIGKSALNGFVFGLCAAIVICIVLVIGNKTFLKQNEEVKDVASTDEWVADSIEKSDDSDATDSKNDVDTVENVKPQQTSVTQSDSNALSVKEIAQKCMPSVVSITTVGVEEVRSWFGGTQQYESQGAGSGIVIGQNDTELLVATNNHVVSNTEEVSVCFDDDNEDAVISAKVKGTDPSNDLAIVSVKKEDIPDDVMANIRVATIGKSDDLQIGEQVVAIGNALGYGQSVTTGIVSALDRTVDIENYSAKLIQTDAAINPGNSGGALLNMQGELVGINSAKYASEEIEGMGYAIPIAIAQPILDDLMNRETRDVVSSDEAGFLGVSVQDVSEEAAELYDIPKGAYVGGVEEGSGAEKAGIQKGDIITKFDGLTISDASSLKSNIAYYKTGETVEVVFMRSNDGAYKEMTVQVTLAKSQNVDASNQKNQNPDANTNQDSEQNNQEENQDQNGENPQNGNSYDSMEDFFNNGGSFRDFFDQFSNGRSQSQSQGQNQSKTNRGL